MLARFRKNALYLMVMLCFLIGAIISSSVVFATAYHTIRINYVYADGTPAHDPYVATYQASEDPLNLEEKTRRLRATTR